MLMFWAAALKIWLMLLVDLVFTVRKKTFLGWAVQQQWQNLHSGCNEKSLNNMQMT